jgi:hypothetical protein
MGSAMFVLRVLRVEGLVGEGDDFTSKAKADNLVIVGIADSATCDRRDGFAYVGGELGLWHVRRNVEACGGGWSGAK